MGKERDGDRQRERGEKSKRDGHRERRRERGIVTEQGILKTCEVEGEIEK